MPEVVRENGGNPERLMVQRILSSRCLEKSARMREFLAYVCDRALNEPHAEIREQEIGCAVFGRAAGYDTNQDNIVRVNASQLRRRLETYFTSEGAMESLILELPKGHYRPLFRLRSDTTAAPQSLAPSDDRDQGRKVRLLAWITVALALLCLGLSATLVASRVARPAVVDAPAMRALWSLLIQKGQSTTLS